MCFFLNFAGSRIIITLGYCRAQASPARSFISLRSICRRKRVCARARAFTHLEIVENAFLFLSRICQCRYPTATLVRFVDDRLRERRVFRREKLHVFLRSRARTVKRGRDHTRGFDFTIVLKSTLSVIDFIRNSTADAEPDTPGRAFLDYS